MKIIFRHNQQRIIADGDTLETLISNLPQHIAKFTIARRAERVLSNSKIETLGHLIEFLKDEYGAIMEYATGQTIDACCGNKCGCG